MFLRLDPRSLSFVRRQYYCRQLRSLFDLYSRGPQVRHQGPCQSWRATIQLPGPFASRDRMDLRQLELNFVEYDRPD